jgi:flavin-dependent dehydrogenase
MFDALIVGAGPAGSATARLLAQAGWSVALVEKTQFPRRKVCGEFISAATMPVLKECGIAPAFISAAGPPVMRVGLYAGNTMLASPQEQVWGRALGREHLDVMLRDAAVDAGAVLFQPVEVAATRRVDNLSICTLEDGQEIVARTVIAASGSWNGKGAFNMPPGDGSPSALFAFKGHFRGGALPQGLMPLLGFPGGYGGMVHTDEGRVSLSCCIRRDTLAKVRLRYGGKAADAVLAHITATTRGVAQALDGAVVDGPLLSVGPIRPGIRPRHADGIFFVGNIAGEAHPIIAEGISMALQSAHMLARMLIAARGDEYAAAWRKRFAPRMRAASLFASLAMRDGTRVASLAAVRALPGILGWGARLSGKVPVST